MASASEGSAICDVAVIGAGISGLAAAKCLLDDKLSIIVYELTDQIGGLWQFREHGYGVMRFTHINVSKHNYCFSDFPFPDDIPDFPHHSHMMSYVHSYADHFNLLHHVRFNTKVINISQTDTGLWEVITQKVDSNGSTVGPQNTQLFKSVAIATGHHALPIQPKFPGQSSFQGDIIHSVNYKDAVTNGMIGKRVVVIGIGNSAVDVAVNVAERGGTKPVCISTRSGAWIMPNYVAGYPTDHYACRAFLWLPWQISSPIFGWIMRCVFGSPWKWGLNPKMGALQTQPTVSPTLVHHIQRNNIIIKPNIGKFDEEGVVFTDGTRVDADSVLCCTGYSINLPFLSDSVKSSVLEEGSNKIKLFKNVFSPEIGPSLAFIGFTQPASGGLLPMSEIQARWFSKLCKGTITLPSNDIMQETMETEQGYYDNRYHASTRHTIQRDPIIYIDEIASYFGAKPQVWRNPSLAWNLLFGTCGAAQWRLQGPNKWSKAKAVVRSVPITPMMHCFGFLAVFLPLLIAVVLYKYCC